MKTLNTDDRIEVYQSYIKQGLQEISTNKAQIDIPQGYLLILQLYKDMGYMNQWELPADNIIKRSIAEVNELYQIVIVNKSNVRLKRNGQTRDVLATVLDKLYKEITVNTKSYINKLHATEDKFNRRETTPLYDLLAVYQVICTELDKEVVKQELDATEEKRYNRLVKLSRYYIEHTGAKTGKFLSKSSDKRKHGLLHSMGGDTLSLLLTITGTYLINPVTGRSTKVEDIRDIANQVGLSKATTTQLQQIERYVGDLRTTLPAELN